MEYIPYLLVTLLSAAITIETAARQSEKVISQLTLQLEIAQESQIEAEENAERLRLELDSLRAKNDKLKSELNEIGQMATVLEQERQTAVAKAAQNTGVVERETLERKIRELESELADSAVKLGKGCKKSLSQSLVITLCIKTTIKRLESETNLKSASNKFNRARM